MTKKLLVLSQALLATSLLWGMDVPVPKEEAAKPSPLLSIEPTPGPKAAAVPPEIIAIITPYVADAANPWQAVQNVTNFLLAKKEWAPWLSDPSLMRTVAENISKKFNISLLDALMLLRTKGAQIAYEQELKRDRIKRLIETELALLYAPVIYPLNNLLLSLKNELFQDEGLRKWLIDKMYDRLQVKSLDNFLRIFVGREDPIILQLVFKGISDRDLIQYKSILQNNLLVAIYERNLRMVRALLQIYKLDPTVVGSEVILSGYNLGGETPIKVLLRSMIWGTDDINEYITRSPSGFNNYTLERAQKSGSIVPPYLFFTGSSKPMLDFMILQDLIKAGVKVPLDLFAILEKQVGDNPNLKFIIDYIRASGAIESKK